MLIIKPIQDKNYQEEVCRLCGFDYNPLAFAYDEKENDTLIAGCQFDILGTKAVILNFGMVQGVDEDIEALIILGRSVMNFLELAGAKTCTFNKSNEAAERYSKMLGFKEKDGEFVIELEGLFDGKCTHCK